MPVLSLHHKSPANRRRDLQRSEQHKLLTLLTQCYEKRDGKTRVPSNLPAIYGDAIQDKPNTVIRKTGKTSSQYLDFELNSRASPLRRLALRMLGTKCQICGIKENLQIHHKTPRRVNGTDDLSNLVVLCRNHHQAAHRNGTRAPPLSVETLNEQNNINSTSS